VGSEADKVASKVETGAVVVSRKVRPPQSPLVQNITFRPNLRSAPLLLCEERCSIAQRSTACAPAHVPLRDPLENGKRTALRPP
jgi:hypothetical protein